MPLLLRRALAQLRSQDPARWPDREGRHWAPQYPIPVQLNHLGSVGALVRQTASRELCRVLERLECANLGSAWAAVSRAGDDGSVVLLVLIEALRPSASMSAMRLDALIRNVKTTAGEFADALSALQRSGISTGGLLPIPDAKTLRAYPKGHAQGYVTAALTDPTNLLVTLKYISALPDPRSLQRRGSVAKRRAAVIALYLAAFGSECASRLASVATGASITPRAVTKVRNQFAPRRGNGSVD